MRRRLLPTPLVADFKAYTWEIKPHSWIAFNLIDGIIRMIFS